ncbi:MAG: DeoR/GlpR family DNA-binding transcription regulator [Anaerostipes faecalis]|nr:DeoR/GlpR family DNA-binding transcription regulator [Anaerostipes faecalis]
MKKTIRQEKILDYLSQSGRVSISELCTMFGIVPMTARRDLKELEDAHKLIRTHGGAALPSLTINDTLLPFHQRMTQNVYEKEMIAKAALPFVHNKQHIFLASGTTVHIFARMLRDCGNLNIVTDAVNISYELSCFPNIHLISLGGEIRHNSLTTTGPVAESNLNSFQLDCAFIGVNAIDEEGNVFLSSMAEASIVRLLCRMVPEIYFLADKTKIMKKDFIYICPLGVGRNLITNSTIPKSCIKTYEALGANVIY